MRETWGREVVCLFSPNAAVPAGSSDGRNYQVMECRGSTTESYIMRWTAAARTRDRARPLGDYAGSYSDDACPDAY
jgi:hypothetical protein